MLVLLLVFPEEEQRDWLAILENMMDLALKANSGTVISLMLGAWKRMKERSYIWRKPLIVVPALRKEDKGPSR